MNAKVVPPPDLFPEPISEAARSVAALVSKKVVTLEKKRRATITQPTIDRARDSMQRRVASEDWTGAEPIELVALFEWLHRQVYEVDPGLKGRDWLFATGQAKRLVVKDFGGDVPAAIAFIKWAWGRERQREQWRRANNREGLTLGWRVLFCSAWLLSDYRIAQARSHARTTRHST